MIIHNSKTNQSGGNADIKKRGTEKMKVRTKEEAWTIVDELMPTDYELDNDSVACAGYPIYRSTIQGVNAWVCDLNVRLEVNVPDFNGGVKTVSVWFDEPADVTEFKVVEPETEHKHEYEPDPTYVARDRDAAYTMLYALMPPDIDFDEKSTVRAHYPIYRSKSDPRYYFCDLDEYIEVNQASGKSINIWILNRMPFGRRAMLMGRFQENPVQFRVMGV